MEEVRPSYWKPDTCTSQENAVISVASCSAVGFFECLGRGGCRVDVMIMLKQSESRLLHPSLGGGFVLQ